MDPICISLPQVIKGAEILEVLHSLPNIRQYLFSLYECRYSVFFQSLGESAAHHHQHHHHPLLRPRQWSLRQDTIGPFVVSSTYPHIPLLGNRTCNDLMNVNTELL